MRTMLVHLILVFACSAATAQDDIPGQLIALEKSALDRWNAADPQGYLDLYTEDMTYFDPALETRLDGLAAMQQYYAPLFGAQYPFTNPRYEMQNPSVQHYGDVAILSFNLVNYGTFPGQGERVTARWNSTEVYRLLEGRWRISHSHWSYIKSEVPQGPSL